MVCFYPMRIVVINASGNYHARLLKNSVFIISTKERYLKDFSYSFGNKIRRRFNPRNDST